MYWNSEGWVIAYDGVAEGLQARIMLRDIHDYLDVLSDKSEDISSVLATTFPGEFLNAEKNNSRYTSSVGRELLLRSIRFKPLNFYKLSSEKEAGITLLELKVERKRFFTEPQQASLYFIAYRDKNASVNLIQLDGTSAPMHALRATFGGIRLDQLEEYLDFFSSFLSGNDTGSIFTLHTTINSIPWSADYGRRRVVFEPYLQSRINNYLSLNLAEIDLEYGLIKDQFVERYNGYFALDPGNLESLWEFWLKHNGQHDKNDQSVIESETYKTISEAVNFHVSDITTQAAKDENGLEGDDDYACYLGLMQYGNDLFYAWIKVSRNGFVEIVDDTRLHQEYQNLPMDIWRFTDEFDLDFGRGIILDKFHADPRSFENQISQALISVAPIMRPEDYNKIDKTLPWKDALFPVRITNLYAQSYGRLGRSSWEGLNFNRPISVVGVKFLDAINFSEVTFGKSIEFVDCVFTEYADFHNCHVGGNLIFRNCMFYGIPTDGGPLRKIKANNQRLENTEVILNLDGIRVEGDLIIEAGRAYGTVSMHGGRIGRHMQITGFDILPLHNIYFNEDDIRDAINSDNPTLIATDRRRFKNGAGLDLRNSSIGSGLDLTAYFGQRNGAGGDLGSPDKAYPCWIAGPVSLDYCTIGGALQLSGLMISKLNDRLFGHSTTYTGLSLAGSLIRGEVQVWKKGTLPTETFRYQQNYIAGSIDFSGATVEGNMDLRNLWLKDDLRLDNFTCNGNINLLPFYQHYLEQSSTNFFPLWTNTIAGEAQLEIDPRIAVQTGTETRLARSARTYILGSLVANGARIKGKILMKGLYAGRDLKFTDCEIGEIRTGNFIDFVYHEEWSIANSDLPMMDASGTFKDSEDLGAFHEFLKNQKGSFKIHTLPKPHNAEKDTHSLQKLLIYTTQANTLKITNSRLDGELCLHGCYLNGSKNKVWLELPSDNAELKDTIDQLHAVDTERLGNLSDHPDTRKGIWKPNLENTTLLVENVSISGSLAFWNHDQSIDTVKSYTSPELHRRTAWLIEKISGYPRSSDEFKTWLEKIIFEKVCEYRWSSFLTDGHIRVLNTEVHGSIELQGVLTLRDILFHDVEVTGNITCNPDPYGRQNHIGDHTLIARRISMDMIRCGANVKMGNSFVTKGFRLENSKIAGGIHFAVAEKSEDQKQCRAAQIYFTLNLQGSESSGLLVARAGQECQWDFRQFSTRHFEVWQHNASTRQNQLDLRGMQFTYLEINGQSDNEQFAIDLFKDLISFTAEPYTIVESHYRTLGLKGQADRIYIESQRGYRSIRYGKKKYRNKLLALLQFFTTPLKQSFNVVRPIYHELKYFYRATILDRVLAYLVKWDRFFLMGSFLFLFTWLFTLNPGNWQQTSSEAIVPIREQYSPLLKAVEINIPFFNKYESKYQVYDLRVNGVSYLGSNYDPCENAWWRSPYLPISPVNLATLLRIIGFINWSFFLFAITRSVRRE